MLFYYCGLKSQIEVKVTSLAKQAVLAAATAVTVNKYQIRRLASRSLWPAPTFQIRRKKQIDKRPFFFHRVPSRFKRLYEFWIE